jgi:hypothetical protein
MILDLKGGLKAHHSSHNHVADWKQRPSAMETDLESGL